MMSERRFFQAFVPLVTLAAALATAIGGWAAEPGRSRAGPEAVAREILDAAGVKGGLVVHFGCGGGELTAALHSGDAYLVHGLDADAKNVAAARRYIQSLGLYGKVSVEQWTGKGLPYADNLVNLLVISDAKAKIAEEEIQRVLPPGGTALRLDPKSEIQNPKYVKPWPKEIDQWTHALHDASNNSVSKDTVVGPPRQLQWVAEPQNTRHHEAQASVSVVVSAGGRLFSIEDEAPLASLMLPPEWRLVARDAFNGVPLWKRPIAGWESYLRGKSAGPPELARRLVANGDRVYVTLGLDAPLVALDAASGRTLTTYQGTEATEEILYRDGVLYLVVGTRASGKDERAAAPAFRQDSRSAASPVKTMMAIDAASGRTLWKRTEVQPLPMSLAAGSSRLFWLAPDGVVCADPRSGAEVWRTKREVAAARPTFSAPTLVVEGDVVLCADRRATPSPDVDESTGKQVPKYLSQASALGDLVAYAVQDGRPLWTAHCAEAYCAPIDVFVHDGLVWLGQSRARQGPDFTAGLDLLTGEVKRRLSPERAFESTMSHHRCYRNCATARYLLTGRTGVEFIDFASGEALRHHWVRGVCQYGVVPANGLLYVPPHSCACYIEAKLTGLLALAPARGQGPGARNEGRGARNEGRGTRDEGRGGRVFRRLWSAGRRMLRARIPDLRILIPNPQSLIPPTGLPIAMIQPAADVRRLL
jgi:outer membrane protein assembly factor BamB